MKFFKPEDFISEIKWKDTEESLMNGLVRIEVAILANAKLERESKVIYMTQTNQPTNNMLEKRYDWHTHKALLINIEPIEKCVHPTEKVHIFYNYDDLGREIVEGFECSCGIRVQATKFEEVK